MYSPKCILRDTLYSVTISLKASEKQLEQQGLELLQRRHQLGKYWCWPAQHKLGHAFNRCKNWWNVYDYHQYWPGNLQKTCSAKVKSKKTPNAPRQKGFDEKNIKIAKENTDVNKPSNQRKWTKSYQRNLKQLKNFNKYRKKSNWKESYCCYQEKTQILLQIRKKQIKDQSWNWTSPGWREELGTKQQKNERTTEWTIQ